MNTKTRTPKKATTKKIGQVRKSSKVAKAITKNLNPINKEVGDFVQLLEINSLSSEELTKIVSKSLQVNESFLLSASSYMYQKFGSKNTKLDTLRKTIKRVSSKLAKDEQIKTPLTLKLMDKEKALFVLKEHTPKEQETTREKLMKMFEKHHAELTGADWSVIIGYHAENNA